MAQLTTQVQPRQARRGNPDLLTPPAELRRDGATPATAPRLQRASCVCGASWQLCQACDLWEKGTVLLTDGQRQAKVLWLQYWTVEQRAGDEPPVPYQVALAQTACVHKRK